MAFSFLLFKSKDENWSNTAKRIIPPPIKVNNENGAGDVLSAIFNYFYCCSFDELGSLTRSICAGTLHASGYKNNKEKYLQKLDKLSRSIKFKITN